ncbi:hypothetical protein Pmani_036777, partial [Petrolisthes manimaculis]
IASQPASPQLYYTTLTFSTLTSVTFTSDFPT